MRKDLLQKVGGAFLALMLTANTASALDTPSTGAGTVFTLPTEVNASVDILIAEGTSASDVTTFHFAELNKEAYGGNAENVKYSNGNFYIDGVRGGGYITFNLKNDGEEGPFEVHLKTATNANGNTLTISISDRDGSNEASGQVDIENTGGWEPKADGADKRVLFEKVGTGEKLLKIFIDGNGGWKGSFGFISIKKVSNETRYTLTTAVDGNGTVKGGATYVAGETATLEAVPGWGWDFEKWTTEDGTELSTENPYNYTMPAANTTVKAVFKQRSTTLNVPSTEPLDITVGTISNLAFKAQAGYDATFDSVRDGATATYNLNVTKTGKLAISLLAGTQLDGIQVNFTITGATEVANKTLDVQNDGGWNNFNKIGFETEQAVEAGTYTLVITFTSGAGGYTCNAAELRIEEAGNSTAIKTIEAAQAFDGVYYNLAGQRLAQPAKGVNIVNGKKIVVK